MFAIQEPKNILIIEFFEFRMNGAFIKSKRRFIDEIEGDIYTGGPLVDSTIEDCVDGGYHFKEIRRRSCKNHD